MIQPNNLMNGFNTSTSQIGGDNNRGSAGGANSSAGKMGAIKQVYARYQKALIMRTNTSEYNQHRHKYQNENLLIQQNDAYNDKINPNDISLSNMSKLKNRRSHERTQIMPNTSNLTSQNIKNIGMISHSTISHHGGGGPGGSSTRRLTGKQQFIDMNNYGGTQQHSSYLQSLE